MTTWWVGWPPVSMPSIPGTAPGAVVARAMPPLPHHPPDVVVHPGSAEEAAQILRLATEAGGTAGPRGAGTNLRAARPPLTVGIVPVWIMLNRIREISPIQVLTMRQPGVPTAPLAAAAAEHRSAYPPDPDIRTVPTIGAGQCASIDDYILVAGAESCCGAAGTGAAPARGRATMRRRCPRLPAPVPSSQGR